MQFRLLQDVPMTKEEYHKILFELGLLDDEEDWELYKLQEARYEVDEYYDKYTVEKPLKTLYN